MEEAHKAPKVIATVHSAPQARKAGWPVDPSSFVAGVGAVRRDSS